MDVLEFSKATPSQRYDYLLELVRLQLDNLSATDKQKTLFEGMKNATEGREVEFLHLPKTTVTYIATRFLGLPFSSESDEKADGYLQKLDINGYRSMYEAFLASPKDEILQGNLNSDLKTMYYFKMAK